MSVLRKFSPLLLLAIAFLALPPAAAQDSMVFVPGSVFRIDTPRPGVQVVGEPQTTHAPGIGRDLVAWLRSGPDGVAHVIWARQVDSEGLTPGALSPERVLARAPGKRITGFSLSSGWYHYALAWSTFDPVLRRHELFARVFDLFLNPVSPPIRIEIGTTEEPGQVWVSDGPRAGIDDSGRLVVAWSEEWDLYGLGRVDLAFVRARRYGLDGKPVSGVVSPAGWPEGGLALSVAPGGSFMLAWEEYDSDRQTRVGAALYGPDGTERRLFLPPGEATGLCLHSAKSPALAAGYSAFFVAYADEVGQAAYGNFGFDPRCRGVFAQVYDLSGGLLRWELRVKRDSWSPIVQNNRGQFLVTWEGEPPALGGARQRGTYAHPYLADGYSAGPELFIQQKPVTSVAFEPAGALLVWAEKGVRARHLTQERP